MVLVSRGLEGGWCCFGFGAPLEGEDSMIWVVLSTFLSNFRQDNFSADEDPFGFRSIWLLETRASFVLPPPCHFGNDGFPIAVVAKVLRPPTSEGCGYWMMLFVVYVGFERYIGKS